MPVRPAPAVCQLYRNGIELPNNAAIAIQHRAGEPHHAPFEAKRWYRKRWMHTCGIGGRSPLIVSVEHVVVQSTRTRAELLEGSRRRDALEARRVMRPIRTEQQPRQLKIKRQEVGVNQAITKLWWVCSSTRCASSAPLRSTGVIIDASMAVTAGVSGCGRHGFRVR